MTSFLTIQLLQTHEWYPLIKTQNSKWIDWFPVSSDPNIETYIATSYRGVDLIQAVGPRLSHCVYADSTIKGRLMKFQPDQYVN